jgi:hypothetical protein
MTKASFRFTVLGPATVGVIVAFLGYYCGVFQSPGSDIYTQGENALRWITFFTLTFAFFMGAATTFSWFGRQDTWSFPK